MDSQTNFHTYVSDETPNKLSTIAAHRSSTPFLDLSMSDADGAALHTKDSQEIKPWTIFNSRLMAVVKEIPKPASKERLPKGHRVTPITNGRRLYKDRMAIAIHHASSSKLEESTSKDNQLLTDMSLEIVRPRAQTENSAVMAAERRKSPETTTESKSKLLNVGRVESDKPLTHQSSRHLASANSSLLRKINLSRKKDVDKTFDDGKLSGLSLIENVANVSFDHVNEQPNKLPTIGAYGVLEALNAKKQLIEQDKKFLPQMFLREEPQEKPTKPKTKQRMKSELSCWREQRRPVTKNPTMKTEEEASVAGYFSLPKPPKDLLNLLVCAQKPRQLKPQNVYLEEYYKNCGSEAAKRNSGFSYYTNSSIQRTSGSPFKRKNSPGPWGPSGRGERIF